MAELRLCEGYVPQYKEMVKLSKPLLKLIISDLGLKETIKRFSDPFWFQSLACAMGFEHNYTGATTVTLKAIKEAFSEDNEFIVLGGKGKEAVSLVNEVERKVAQGTIKDKIASNLIAVSRETAKADNSLLQDSYDLYFHVVITDGIKNIVVINQGMNVKEKLVRRYHWYNPSTFEDPSLRSYTAKVSLDLQHSSDNMKESIFDIVKDENPERIIKKVLLLSKHYELYKKCLRPLMISKEERKLFESMCTVPYYLYFPKRMNKEAIEIAKETALNFRDIALVSKMGKSTLRGLAYLASLVYGTPILWENPQRYCYSFGTKAGKPWYIERDAMREAALYLMEVIKEGQCGEKKKILKRLSKIVENKSKC